MTVIAENVRPTLAAIDFSPFGTNNFPMNFWRRAARFRPHKVPHYLAVLTDALVRRRRIDQSADTDALRAFWREHGREWASQEASPEDLEQIASLARRVARFDKARTETEVVGELKSIWGQGFTNPVDAFGWDEMNDQLPPAAMVAFVEGVGAAWNDIQKPS